MFSVDVKQQYINNNNNVLFYVSVFVLHGAVGIVLFVWTPSADTPYVVYICAGLWGFGYSVYAAILSRKFFYPLYTGGLFHCFYVG